MLGIKYKIKNEYDQFLDKILEEIGTDESKWSISDDETYKKNGENLFNKELYKNDEFKNLIHHNYYYSVFVTIQLYHQKDNVQKIKNAKDFLDSNCQLILFITDNEFVEIYCKKEQSLEILSKNAITHHFRDLQYITFEKDAKKIFSAYTD